MPTRSGGDGEESGEKMCSLKENLDAYTHQIRPLTSQNHRHNCGGVLHGMVRGQRGCRHFGRVCVCAVVEAASVLCASTTICVAA